MRCEEENCNCVTRHYICPVCEEEFSCGPYEETAFNYFTCNCPECGSLLLGERDEISIFGFKYTGFIERKEEK